MSNYELQKWRNIRVTGISELKQTKVTLESANQFSVSGSGTVSLASSNSSSSTFNVLLSSGGVSMVSGNSSKIQATSGNYIIGCGTDFKASSSTLHLVANNIRLHGTQSSNTMVIDGAINSTNPSDDEVATIGYVKSNPSGNITRTPVQYATIGILMSSPTYTSVDLSTSSMIGDTLNATVNEAFVVDGQSPIVGNRILVKNQASQSHNGPYEVKSLLPYVLERVSDFDEQDEISGSTFFVEGGNTLIDSSWTCTTERTDMLTGGLGDGMTNIIFEQATAPRYQIEAGAGLTQTGDTFDVVSALGTITINTDDIDLNQAYNFTFTGSTINFNATNRTVGLTSDTIDLDATNVTIDSAATLDVALTTNDATTTTLNINSVNTGAGSATISMNATDEIKLTSSQVVINGNMDLNSTQMSLQSTSSSDLSMIADSASTETFTIEAKNTNASGTAELNLTASGTSPSVINVTSDNLNLLSSSISMPNVTNFSLGNESSLSSTITTTDGTANYSDNIVTSSGKGYLVSAYIVGI